MIHPRRLFRAVVLSLLLLGVQYGGQLHALEHLGEGLRHAHDQSFSVPADEVCAICALFAGGANALNGDADAAFSTPVAREVTSLPHASLAAAAPRYYERRAPPSLL